MRAAIFTGGERVRICFADFAFQLPRQIIQLPLRVTQRVGLAAEHAVGGALDAFGDFGDVCPSRALGLACLREKSALRQLRFHVEQIVRVHLVGAAQGVIQLLREQRLGGFGLLGHVPHLGEQIRQRALLLRHLPDELLSLRGIIQRFLRAVVERIQSARDFVFLIYHVARLAAHLPHLVGKLAGGLPLHILAGLIQLLLRARARRERLRRGLVLKLLGSALHILTGLIQLLLRVRLLAGIGRLRELLAQFIHVCKLLALLVGEALELFLNILALLVGARGLQRGLQLAHPVVQILLPLRQFLQAVHRLRLLALLRVLRSGRLTLGFVTVLFIGQIKLVELLLVRLAGGLAGILTLAVPLTLDAKFARRGLEQRLIRGLLGGDGGGQFVR